MVWELILTEVFFIGLFAGAIRLATPLLIAALGEIYAERSGVLNLGLEGIMEAGAIIGFLTTFITGSPWLGIFAAMVFGIFLGFIKAVMSVSLGTNQVINGLLITTLGTGIGLFVYRGYFGATAPTIPIFEAINFPVLSDIPFIGPIFFSHNILVYLGLILAAVLGIILYRTTIGLKIKAVGENPKAADTLGINIFRVRYLCVMISGAMAGIAGAFITVGYLGIYGENLIAGRGFIAVVIAIFSRWSPYRCIGASLIFGAADALTIRLRATGIGIPYHLLLMVPYVLVVVLITITFRRAKPPAAITKPYKRGE